MDNSTVLLIPYYNNSEGLLKSLRSINPDEELDVIIVDDGSITDKFDEAVVRSNFKARGTVLFEYLKSNKGIETALNSGLKISLDKKYKYITRLDCGDICIGKRFAVQKAFLEENPEIKIVGSNVLAVDTKGDFLYSINLPLNDKEIKKKMYLNSMLIHPAVMFSAEILDSIGLYPLNHKFAEDYAFFFTISQRYKMANIEEYLTQIEINENGISLKKRKQQVKSRITIIKKHFYFGFYPVYGLFRNYILLFLPYNLILFIKKIRK